MKAEIIARETVRPSSPITPKNFSLSLTDQLSSPVYTKLYFFYRNTSTDEIEEAVAKRSQCLKSSLSQVLNLFYPIAGKIRDDMSVSLEEDDGAEFLEARVDFNLFEYLEKPFPEMFLHLVPDDFWETGRRPHLIVQASFFKCGGLAIGLNISHKVCDGFTFTFFINAWADAAFGKSDYLVAKTPDYNASLAFPAVEGLFVSGEHFGEMVQTNNKTKRFVFTATKIAELQEKVTEETTKRATRIEAVTAFLWRIGMKMSMKRAGGSAVTSVMLMPVNIRKWLKVPHVSEQTFGNMAEFQIIPNNSCDIALPYLFTLVTEKLEESRQAYAKKLDEKQFIKRYLGIIEKFQELIPQSRVKNAFMVSSWSRFSLYDADFGWGKPIWVATHNPVPYVTYIIDTRDGTGFEAWVNFPEEEMAIFACDEELLAYATADPSAL